MWNVKELLRDEKPFAIRNADGMVFKVGIYEPDPAVWTLIGSDGYTFGVSKRTECYKFYNLDKVTKRNICKGVVITKLDSSTARFSSWYDALHSDEAVQFLGVKVSRIYIGDIFQIMLDLAEKNGVTNEWKKCMRVLANDVDEREYMYIYYLDGYPRFIRPYEMYESEEHMHAVKDLCEQLGYTVEEKYFYE